MKVTRAIGISRLSRNKNCNEQLNPKKGMLKMIEVNKIYKERIRRMHAIFSPKSHQNLATLFRMKNNIRKLPKSKFEACNPTNNIQDTFTY